MLVAIFIVLVLILIAINPKMVGLMVTWCFFVFCIVIAIGAIYSYYHSETPQTNTSTNASIDNIKTPIPTIEMAPEPSVAASLDCQKARKSTLELLICDDPSLSTLDGRVDKYYSRIQESFIKGSIDSDQSLAAQQKFLQMRTDRCPIPFTPNLSEGQTARIISCLKDFYTSRLTALQTQWVGILRPKAEHGDAKSQFNLGAMYHDGYGVSKDEAEAIKWWRKSAEQGFAKAQLRLGAAYHEGSNVTKDYTESANWLRKAAEQDDAEAEFLLGSLYIIGQGVPQDRAMGMEWLNKSALQGNKEAVGFLRQINGEGSVNAEAGSAKPINLESAFFLLKQCVSSHIALKDYINDVQESPAENLINVCRLPYEETILACKDRGTLIETCKTNLGNVINDMLFRASNLYY